MCAEGEGGGRLRGGKEFREIKEVKEVKEVEEVSDNAVVAQSILLPSLPFSSL